MNFKFFIALIIVNVVFGQSLIAMNDPFADAQWASAIELKQKDKIAKLIREKYDVNRALQEELGNTALMEAAKEGDIELVELLLKNNADISNKDIFGKDVFQYAQQAPVFTRDKIIQLLNEAKGKQTSALEEEWVEILSPQEEIEEEWEKL